MYGGTFDKPVLVICQLSTNWVVVGAGGDVLGGANHAHIISDKATVAESVKAAILLYGDNGHKYKHIKYY